MADNRKLTAGLLKMPEAQRQDLAQRAQDMEREGVVGMLRKAGKEMYENPIVNTAIGLTPVLGDVQAAGETMAALGRGAPWQETAGYAAGMLPFIPMIGKTVWHGSPHTFDKFDLSKIGTGEGAQAYGHGLYLAEARPVAEEYARMNITGPSNVAHVASKGPISPIDTLKMVYPNKPDEFYEAAIKGAEEPGNLYKVDLPDEQIAKMLDWDKPLSQQAPEVLQALEQSPQYQHFVNINQQNPNLFQHPSEFEAKKFYGMIGESPEDASRILREQGIPGIQYLDQASRGAGEGTRNYVVFSDEIPQILERNGQPIAQALRNYEAPQAQALREAEEYGQKMLGLPPGNTPMDRAIAGGYIDPSYHGTKTDVPEFDLSYHGTATDPGDFGEALYSSANPDIAGHYAESTMRGATTEGANIMPLLTRKGNQMQVEGMKGMEPLLEKAGGIENWFDMNPQQQAQIAKDMGYTSVRDFGYPQTANYDLGDVRSKFAAFDPRYFGKPGLMLGAGGLGVYGALQGEDEYQ